MSLTSSRPASEPISAAEIDQLIGAVAARHGFLLDRRDPVLATVTLHELVIERLLVRIDKAAEAARLEIGAGAHQHTEAVKTAASHLITRAAEYADEQFRLAARAAADEIRSGVLKQLSENPPGQGCREGRLYSFHRSLEHGSCVPGGVHNRPHRNRVPTGF